MSNTSLIPSYAVDLSGDSILNKVVERHTVTALNQSEFNIIIPRCAPFYREGLSIKKLTTNELLIYGKDYFVGGYYPELSQHTHHLKQVYGVIVFHDRIQHGDYEITYQTFGGPEILDEQQLVQIITNKRFNPFQVRWLEIINRPIQYQPDDHTHPATNVHTYADMIAEFTKLNETISEWLHHNKLDAPDFTQLLLSQLELNQRVNGLVLKLDDLDAVIKGTNKGQLDEIVKNLEQLKRQTGLNLDALSGRVDTNETAIAALTAALPREIGQLADRLNQKDVELIELNNTVKQQSDDNKKRIELMENNLSQVPGQVDEKIKALETRLSNENGNSSAQLAARVSRLDSRLNQTINELLPKENPVVTGMLETPKVRTNTIVGFGQNSDAGEAFHAESTALRVTPTEVIVGRYHGNVVHDGRTRLTENSIATEVLHVDKVRIGAEGSRDNAGELTYDEQTNTFTAVSNNGTKSKIVAGDFTNASGKSLSDAVWRTGDKVDNYILSKVFKESVVATTNYNGFVFRPGITTLSNKKFYPAGIQYFNDTPAIRRMLAFDENDPFAVFVQSWDKTNGAYLGARPLGVTLVNELRDHTTDDDIYRAPSQQLFHQFATKIAPDQHFTNIQYAYNRAPLVSPEHGFNIADRLVFNEATPSRTSKSTVTFKELGSSLGKGLEFTHPLQMPNFRLTSDERLKENIRPLSSVKHSLRQIGAYSFTLKEKKIPTYGVIAQELEKFFPELVSRSPTTDMRSVDYAGFTAVLLKAVQELSEEVAQLREEVKHLKRGG